MIKDENFICLHGWMINRLKLGGNELLAYALIYGFSQAEGCKFTGSYKYMSEWMGCCEKTAINTIDKLVEKKLVIKVQKNVNGMTYNEYEAVISDTAVEKKKKTVEKEKVEKVKKAPLIEREPENDIEKVEKKYLENHYSLYQREKVNEEKPYVNWGKSRKLTSELLSEIAVDKIIDVLDKAKSDNWIVENGYCLTTILSRNVFNRLLNARPTRNGVGVGRGVDEYVDSEGVIF